jgi:hypothetical protein
MARLNKLMIMENGRREELAVGATRGGILFK